MQEIADQLGVPVETIIAIARGEAEAVPAAPGAVGRAYAERLESLPMPADYGGDPYAFGMEVEFTPSPNAVLSGLWAFETVVGVVGTRTFRHFRDHNGTAADIAQLQANGAALVQQHELLLSLNSAMPYFLPKGSPVDIRVGLRHHLPATGQTGAVTIRNQRIWLWEIAPS